MIYFFANLVRQMLGAFRASLAQMRIIPSVKGVKGINSRNLQKAIDKVVSLMYNILNLIMEGTFMAFRLQVMITDEMLEKIDYYAEKTACSRSSLCSMFIGQGLMAFDKSFEVVDSLASGIKVELEKKLGEQLKIDGEK